MHVLVWILQNYKKKVGSHWKASHHSLIQEQPSAPSGCCGTKTAEKWTDLHPLNYVLMSMWNYSSVNQPFAVLHQFDGIIDLVQIHVMCNELIHLQLLVQVGFNHKRYAIPTLKAWVKNITKWKHKSRFQSTDRQTNKPFGHRTFIRGWSNLSHLQRQSLSMCDRRWAERVV